MPGVRAFHSTDDAVVAEPPCQLVLQRRRTGSSLAVAAQLVPDTEIEQADSAHVTCHVAERLALYAGNGTVDDREIGDPTQTGKGMSAQRRQPEVDDAQMPDADEVAECADVDRERSG